EVVGIETVVDQVAWVGDHDVVVAPLQLEVLDLDVVGELGAELGGIDQVLQASVDAGPVLARSGLGGGLNAAPQTRPHRPGGAGVHRAHLVVRSCSRRRWMCPYTETRGAGRRLTPTAPPATPPMRRAARMAAPSVPHENPLFD